MARHHPPRTFDDLVAEAESAPVEGWGFSWLEGRATEERPPWGYAALAAGRLGGAEAALDIQTGGGEVLSELLERAPRRPRLVAATEGWVPNLRLARDRLVPQGVGVVKTGEGGGLPFASCSFDLVVSRHPTAVVWAEVARVLRTGGTYLAQHVGAGSNRELTEFMDGSRPPGELPTPEAAAAQAEAAGLTVVDLAQSRLRAEFGDVGAVVYFLRKVVWTVPGFTVPRYRARLLALHRHIEEHGSFVSHAERFLIEAVKTTSSR